MAYKIFISYSRKNSKQAQKIFKTLKSKNHLVPWIDTENLLPGMKWKPAIRKAIRESDYFMALLSNYAVSEKGFVHDETKEAIEVYKEFPEDKIFLIPIRLDDCKLPFKELKDITYVDFFPDWDKGIKKVLKVFPKPTKTPFKISETIANTLPDKVEMKNIITEKELASLNLATNYHYRIGIIDLDKDLIDTRLLADKLNSAQNFFYFRPTSLPNVSKAVEEIDGITNLSIHEIPNKWFKEPKILDIDLACCLTKYPLAFLEEDTISYNYFAVPADQDERFMFVSTDQLREFTNLATCSFEKGVIHIMLSLITDYFIDLGYHKTTKGCPMDFCENRSDLVIGLKKKSFCPQCTRKIKNSEYGKAIEAILEINI